MCIIKSFKFAFAGIKEAFKTEKNMKVHIIMAIAVLICAWFLKFSTTELTILTLAIGLVLGFELINTSLEEIVNIVSPEKQEKARAAKDLAAAAVLISAVVAVLVGIFLFVPKCVNGI